MAKKLFIALLIINLVLVYKLWPLLNPPDCATQSVCNVEYEDGEWQIGDELE